MTHQASDREIRVLTAEDRESLRDAQQVWASPAVVALFEEGILKEEVLRAYRQLRKCGQDPDSALFWALYDWDLA